MSVCAAAVLTAYRAPLELREYPVPDTGAGEALIRVEMAGVCGTDVHLCDGELNIPLPVILGHETVGRIEKLGQGLQERLAGPAPGRRRPSHLGQLGRLRPVLLLPAERPAYPLCGAQGVWDFVLRG